MCDTADTPITAVSSSIKYGKTCAGQPNGLEHNPTDTDHTQPTRTTRTQTKKTVFEIPKSANPLTPALSRVVYASKQVV